jgi:hypothetical protein
MHCFGFILQLGNDRKTLVGWRLRNAYGLPFSNGEHFATVLAPLSTAWQRSGTEDDRLNTGKVYLGAVKVCLFGAAQPRGFSSRNLHGVGQLCPVHHGEQKAKWVR